jgi:hypothetical protein
MILIVYTITGVAAIDYDDITFTNEEFYNGSITNSKIIEIDSYVDRIDLQQSLSKLKSINEMMKIEEKNYQRLLKVSSKSGFEKDNQKLKVINFETSKADIQIRIANLRDSIKNKKLVEKSNYIYNIAVKEGNYVTPGTLLYEAKDLSSGKLEIFVPISDVDIIKDKKIFIDGEATDLKIDRIFDVADSLHISSYKVKIIINNPKTFSRLVKIEFK